MYNWTDLLHYDGNETYNGVPSYRYVNPDIMDVKYWQSIETGLPVAWYNVPNATVNPHPIIQYFYAGVSYNNSLPVEYFTLPDSCNGGDVPYCDEEVYTEEPCPASSSSSDDGISAGAVAGIAIASCAMGIVIGWIMIYFRKLHIKKTFSRENLAKEVEKASNPMVVANA